MTEDEILTFAALMLDRHWRVHSPEPFPCWERPQEDSEDYTPERVQAILEHEIAHALTPEDWVHGEDLPHEAGRASPLARTTIMTLTAEALAEALCAAMPHDGGGSRLGYEEALEAAQKALEAVQVVVGEERGCSRHAWEKLALAEKLELLPQQLPVEGRWDLACRVAAGRLATKQGRGLLMQIHSGHTVYHSDPSVPVGQMRIDACRRYKGQLQEFGLFSSPEEPADLRAALDEWIAAR